MNKSKNTGITLVALVITIIILLILAGISISSLTNSGLFENAKLAEERTKNAQEKENSILSEYADLINQYAKGITWTMNEETGEITGGGKTLHVGDYVNYQAKVTNATDEQLTALNTQLNTYSGATDNALANEALEWRVLDVVNGQIRLISATPTTKTISLCGEDGYNNAVYLIDNACKTLYNSSYASKVQNLKIEDIEKYLTYDYTQFENGFVDTKKYGGTAEYIKDNYRYYPNIFAKEKTGWVDDVQGTELGLSQQKTLITGSTMASSKIKATQTFWEKTMATTDFKNSIYYTLYINNGSNYSKYLMSSRCVHATINPIFNVSAVYSGRVFAYSLCISTNAIGSTVKAAFRPVITLRSNVSIGKGNGDTTPYELIME